MVFSWHFIHAGSGYPVPFEGAPRIFFMSTIDEGHTGVALFMTISGYLFAKILHGRDILYFPFIFNRALRLIPLLALVVFIVGVQHWLHGGNVTEYVRMVASGLYAPTIPNGGWSITVEFHFYIILPFLLAFSRRRPLLLFAILAAFLALRCYMYARDGSIQWFSYWTIIGRMDQFILGMIFFHFGRVMQQQHVLALLAAVLFSGFYWYFDALGGFYQIGSYPSSNAIWLIIPTVEGAAYGALIAYYDRSYQWTSENPWANLLAKIGECSYSLYLLHFFFVFWIADLIHTRVVALNNFYIATFASLICFLTLVPLARLSFRYVEVPFLKLRVNYVRVPQAAG